MCNHDNIIHDGNGTTCADCYTYFDKSLCSEFTTNYNGPILNLLQTKSAIINTLEKEFGINDCIVSQITEKIFNITSNNRKVKGTNKRAMLCASLYYAYHYLNKPKNFEDMLTKFEISYKVGSKGLKLCQIAIQEYSATDGLVLPFEQLEEIIQLKGQIHSFMASHKEKLQELMCKYNIPLKNYNEIEKIIVISHFKKNKILNDRINNLWISCIFFWLLKVNPHIDPEEFISINKTDTITLAQLRSDLLYLNKNLTC